MAAISLRPALDEAKAQFLRRHKRASIAFNYAASGILASQVALGAPFDLFISASEAHLQRVRSQLLPGSTRVITGNQLVLVLPQRSAFVPPVGTALTSTKLKRIAIGNPRSVPLGQYARQILRANKLWHAVKGKLVYGEHAQQVLDYVLRGEVDAALVYASDAKRFPGKLQIIALPVAGTRLRIVYPAAILKSSQRPKLARAFLDFLTSPAGVRILRMHGFLAANGSQP